MNGSRDQETDADGKSCTYQREVTTEWDSSVRGPLRASKREDLETLD